MKQEYQKLFTPFKIGKCEIRNRFAMAPMQCADINPNYTYTQNSIDYYIERAKGGTGLIITGANFADIEVEKKLPAFASPMYDSVAYIKGIRKMVDGCHAYDSKVFVQLTAGLGRSAMPVLIKDGCYVAPSETTNRWDPSIVHRALTTEEVYKIIDSFAKSAKIVQMAGADGIEVHAVHEGYLMDNFTWEYFNHRDDEFGGDLKGRLRFPIAVLEAVKKACGKDFPVILRYSLKSFMKEERKGLLPGEEGPELGRDIEEGLEVVKILAEAGYDGFNVDAGSYDSFYWPHPPFFMPRGCYIPFAELVKTVTDKPVLMAGRMGYPELCAETINAGKTDMVVLGRPLLADPEFVNKMRAEQEEDIRPCLSCHDGCFNRASQFRSASCVVNPRTLREKETAIVKAEVKKKAVVIGAGPIGMEAALVLKERGHDVEIYEKNDEVGGLYRYAVMPSFKDDGKRLLAWFERMVRKNNIPIHFGYEVKANDPMLKEADVVIHATGATAFVPKVTGYEKAILATEALDGSVPLKDHITIVGAGQVGCELAIEFGQKGHKVRLVDMASELMASGKPGSMNEQMMVELLEKYEVEIVLNAALKEVKDDAVVVEKEGTETVLSTDQCIFALGYRADKKLYDEIANQVKEIYNVGDSKFPSNLMEGIFDAFELCSHI